MKGARVFPVADDYVSRLFLAGGMASFAGLFVTAPALLFDDRLLNGVAVWWKPLKFWLALGVHFITLALLAQLLSASARRSWSLRVVAALSVGAMLLENVYITIQAARGRASHFNYETPFESTMYIAMGVGALLLLAPALQMGVTLARTRAPIAPGLKAGASCGLILGSILTIAFAGYMSAYGSHFYAPPPGADDAGGVALFGWSTRYADMRPAHFVATHLFQFGPLAGLLFDRFAGRAAAPLAVAATIAVAIGAAVLFLIAISANAPLSLFARDA